MLYKASEGKIKDNAMIYADGTYYMFSMYHKENSDEFNNVWLATSEDGVHFKDYGCVIEDFPNFIWAMKIHKCNNTYYMNSGSFSESGKQNVLKFWKSTDLIYWEYMPSLEIESPEADCGETRLDCMCALYADDGHYYGYATGQYGYLKSEDGIHWKPFKSNINYAPFPNYNPALGGFEIADFIEFENKFYLFCGGFGHLGFNGYGVFVYESNSPDGPFTPAFPNYRINGTSKRWVNMWERFFEKDGEILAHNYMYDGYSYEMGNVYLPPLKKLKQGEHGLYLEWWEQNKLLYGDLFFSADMLSAQSPLYHAPYDLDSKEYSVSESIPLTNTNSCIIEFDLKLSKNTFTAYSCGGIYLKDDAFSGSAILFDTYGKTDIVYVKNKKCEYTDDTISFGSSAPYYLESDKTYSVKIIENCGMFEIYINNLYLQTFNNCRSKNSLSTHFKEISAISLRGTADITNIKIYETTLFCFA